jgi:hypothetical protein
MGGMLLPLLVLAGSMGQGQIALEWQDTTGWADVNSVLSNAGPNPVHLFSTQQFGDCEVHVEFKIPKGSNSGVYLMGRYEVQILDSTGIADKDMSVHDCGAIYERWKDDKGYEGTPPLVNAFAGADKWNVYDIKFQRPRFDANGKKVENARFTEVCLNDKLIQKDVEVTGPTRAAYFEDETNAGPIVLQGDHGPVSYRNCWAKKL